MKKLLLLSVLLYIGSIYCFGQTSFFYGEKGRKVILKNRTDLSLIKKENSMTTKSLGGIIYELNNHLIVESKSIKTLKSSNSETTSVLEAEDGTLQALTNEILVKPKNIKIKDLIKGLRLEDVVVKIDSIGSTYIIKFNSTNNTMNYANQIYESGLCVFAEPSFIRIANIGNIYYPNQWGLNNTGQNGGTNDIDINAPEAWKITKGSPNIKVAILDLGVELNHPDLKDNLLSGYDATGYNSGGAPKAGDSHGTRCAGIVAALDNNIGVVGVAPKCKIIPIRIGIGTGGTNFESKDTWLINSINYAWNTAKADVISNSWGMNGTLSQAIRGEIADAVTKGRNGKGAIVLFNTGNDALSSVSYEASDRNVIGVGAISRLGRREGFSNYGEGLDIVAPGSNIPTTNNNGGYDMKFDGTSAACPHVAGVAALVFSANPNLTGKQARDIIEGTAYKLDGYSYSVRPRTKGDEWGDPSYPGNGSIALNWNKEIGYGLVNAYNAVLKASNFTLPTLSIVKESNNSIICANENVTYRIKNIEYYTRSSITWTGVKNMTLYSGQGTSAAIFKGSGNSEGITVKATIEFNGNKYTAEYSDKTWVGAPKVAEIIKSPTSLCLNLQDNESRTIFAEIEGATDYKWTQITNNFKMLATFDHAYIVPKLNEGSMKMLCEASNKCGSAKRTHGIYAMWCNPDGTPIENVGGGGSRPPIGGGFNPNSMIISKSLETAPYEDIRIFSFYTGQTVYQEKNTIDFKIENTTLKSGIYIIESTDENGNITRTKVMKK